MEITALETVCSLYKRKFINQGQWPDTNVVIGYVHNIQQNDAGLS